MQNKPGAGPTRSDKTTERMAQERQSPGATSAGGHPDKPGDFTRQAPDSSQAAPSTISVNVDARRADSMAESSQPPQSRPNEKHDAIDDEMPRLPQATRETRIRAKAYRIWQSRDAGSGDAVTDWVQAEDGLNEPQLQGDAHDDRDLTLTEPSRRHGDAG